MTHIARANTAAAYHYYARLYDEYIRFAGETPQNADTAAILSDRAHAAHGLWMAARETELSARRG